MKRITYYSAIILSLLTATLCFGQDKNLKLWYDKPAMQWEETLPLGNGRLGMMPDGKVSMENIVLNDITLWSGSPQDANNYDAHKLLPKVRQLIMDDRNDEAQQILDKDFICRGAGSGNGLGANVPFGSYQVLANLHLHFGYNGVDNPDAQAENYTRELSLQHALAKCTYTINGVTYTREYFTSFEDDVDIIRITASKPKQINCEITVDRPERYLVDGSNSMLQISGQLTDGRADNGMKYLAKISTSNKDGEVHLNGKNLTVRNASELIIYVSAKTNYKDEEYKSHVMQLLAAAKAKTYAEQKNQHILKFKKLFDRVSINIGTDTANKLTTDRRLAQFELNPLTDPGLPALFFQYGRYLLISSVRVGLLPPNLQGLWANQVQTPWNSDYHLDLNIQMCHWPVEVGNLPELDLPLTDYVESLIPNGQRTAKAYYNADGWIAHVIANIWGYTEPGESASWGITKVGPGWLCNNLWQHYAFTEDQAYLKRIYPILNGAAQFYSSLQVTDPKTGWLVTSPSSSPENAFYMANGKVASICMGPTVDNQIIRDLFTHTIYAAEKLKNDPVFKASLEKRLAQIPPPVQVAPDGRVMEWLTDYKEVEPAHRHISHLWGLYPGSSITAESSPQWADAAKKTLEARGYDGTSWSLAYKMLFWARLHDGDRAFKLYTALMRTTLKTDINYGAGGGVYPNLLSAGPPFQLDGNMGGAAAIAEMLLQSQAGFIDLLPALPEAWKKFGKVQGLKARGNYTVNMEWKEGKVTSFKILSENEKWVKVRVNGVIKSVKTERS